MRMHHLMQEVLPQQRTERGLQYERFCKHIHALSARLRSPLSQLDVEELDEELQALQARNAALLALKDLRPGDVHVDEVLQTMSVMFANDEFIGDRLMPVVSTNGKLSAVYFEYNKRDRFAYPDDSMADRTNANELNEGRTKQTIGLNIRALREFLDWLTLQNQSSPLNELMDLQANVLNGLAFRRELRQAAIIGAAGSYGANTIALAAGDRWDTADGGDPGAVVDTARASVWEGVGPGRWVVAISLNVYNVLKRHPRILDTFKYGVGAEGPKQANLQMLAEYFDVDEVVVGRARQDTANEGQAASYSRIWPDVLALLRVSTAPSTRNAAFGFTFQDNPTQSDLEFERMSGAKGGYWARSSHSDGETVVAADCGYLVTTPIG